MYSVARPACVTWRNLRGELGRDQHGNRRTSTGTPSRPRPVGRHVEELRQRRELLAPIVELGLQHLSGERGSLPYGEVGVLERRRFER